jgi:acyl-CoA reductase-like NAD-dependent aldehyde dehydrogenase
VGQSGYGRELGRFGIEEFLVPTSVHLPVGSAVLAPR